jgi:serine protease
VVSSRELGPDSTVFRLSETTTRASLEAVEELRRIAGQEVAEVVPVTYRYPFRIPNDPWYKVQWHFKKARLEKAWDRTVGTSRAVVAIIDTGILPDHPDLDARRLVPGYDFVSDPASAGDGNGWDPDPRDPGTSSDQSSRLHGTHVAGVIGATTNNKVGVSGVDWACKILPIRALGAKEGGKGDDADIAAAIRWAAGLAVPGVPQNENPAHVINLSFGAEGDNSELRQAVAEAQQAGSIIVAAAGNYAINAGKTFPAAYPQVVTVGATDYKGELAGYSSFGPVVEIMAPGGEPDYRLPGTSSTECDGSPCMAGIWSLYRQDGTTPRFGYAHLSGTSQAAPIVSGVVSLMLSQRPGMTSYDVITILRETADHSYMCKEGCGEGLVNAEAAVAMAAGEPIPNNSRAPFQVPPDTIFGSGCAVAAAAAPEGSSPLPLLLAALLAAPALLLRRRRA